MFVDMMKHANVCVCVEGVCVYIVYMHVCAHYTCDESMQTSRRCLLATGKSSGTLSCIFTGLTKSPQRGQLTGLPCLRRAKGD